MIIVTGASNNHYHTLKQFIVSVIKFATVDIELIVYDLGIEPSNYNNLKLLYDNQVSISFTPLDI